MFGFFVLEFIKSVTMGPPRVSNPDIVVSWAVLRLAALVDLRTHSVM